MKALQRMQERSDEAKKNIALLGAGLCTSVIALVWVSTLPAQFETIAKESSENTLVVQEERLPSVSEILADVKNQTAAVVESVEKEEVVILEEKTPVRIKTVPRSSEVRIATTTVKTTE